MYESCDIITASHGSVWCRTCGAVWDPKAGEESPCEAQDRTGTPVAAVIGLAFLGGAVVWFVVAFLFRLGSVAVDIGTIVVDLLSRGWGP